jgi:hypothetical protein
MTQDEECPTCRNPLGASLKALHDDRHRLITFANEQRKINEELFKQEEEIHRRIEILQQNEALLPKETRDQAIPMIKEYEMLKYENAALKKQVGMLIEAENKRQENQVDLKEYESLKYENAALNTQVRLLIEARNRREVISKEAHFPVDEVLDAEKEKNRTLIENSEILRRKALALEDVTKELNRKITRLEKQRENLNQQILDQDDQQEILRAQNQELSTKAILAQKQLNELKNENLRLSVQCQKLAENQTYSAFAINDLELVHALSSHVVEEFSPPSKIVTIGQGPYDEGEFDDYLRQLSIEPYEHGYPWIIVGRQGWTEEQIDELIEDSDLDEVWVFSQELFVAGILTTHDPFSLPVEMLMKFAEGHPALEYLMESGFEWPEINLEEDYGEPAYLLGFAGGVDESPLACLGYHVGMSSKLDVKMRRKLLEMAFKEQIPSVGDEDYMAEWGRPNHSKRLWRIAHHIKREASKRKSINSMRYACMHWKSDSEWLKKQFYTNRMRFKWPDV